MAASHTNAGFSSSTRLLMGHVKSSIRAAPLSEAQLPLFIVSSGTQHHLRYLEVAMLEGLGRCFSRQSLWVGLG